MPDQRVSDAGRPPGDLAPGPGAGLVGGHVAGIPAVQVVSAGQDSGTGRQLPMPSHD